MSVFIIDFYYHLVYKPSMFISWLVIKLYHGLKTSSLIQCHSICDMLFIGGALTHLMNLIHEMQIKSFHWILNPRLMRVHVTRLVKKGGGG